MIVVYDKNMKAIGELEKAYNVSVERWINELWTASFTLTKNDPKQYLCSHLNFIEITGKSGKYYGLYRIMPTSTKKNSSTDEITYKCEHVLATLLDDVMDGYYQYTNYTTTQVLQYILDIQSTKRWELGINEFTRYFHYNFENENGLLAPVLSIPKPFNEPYEFTFDTQVFPWKLNLVRSSNETKAEIRWGKDMIDFDEVSDPSSIVNYLIPKGAGEGVNQLTIEDANNGKRYLKDDESIAKWGKQSYIWIDKRFEDARSLKDNGQSLLDQWKDPKISFTCNSVDLSVKPEYRHERRVLNGVTNIIVEDKEYKARIIAEKIPDLNKEYDVNYEINNKLDDIATTQTDIERKQRVNDAYSQGATNILSFNYQDNCDSNIPALIPFYVDDDVVNINTCELTFRTKPFRAYSRATEGGGAIVKSTGGGGGTVKSTSSGGGTTATSSSGGGTSKSTASGGGSSQTSAGGGDHTHMMFSGTGFDTNPDPNQSVSLTAANGHKIKVNANTSAAIDYYTKGSSGNHSHSVSIPSHSHSFSTPNHSHDVSIPNHTHEINLPNHTHSIELPNHTHSVKHEIIELGSTPSSVTIKVDGNIVPHTSTSGDRINLVDYMSKDSNGKITRGRHEVTIHPNGLARIEADLILRVFIQSRLGGVF